MTVLATVFRVLIPCNAQFGIAATGWFYMPSIFFPWTAKTCDSANRSNAGLRDHQASFRHSLWRAFRGEHGLEGIVSKRSGEPLTQRPVKGSDQDQERGRE